MGDDCTDLKTMEEEIYWKRFRSVQFSQTLSRHYKHQLEVPKKIARNLREKLGKEVSLKVPSGAIWKVGLKTEGDSLYFSVAWKDFVDDNSLEESDVLIFKYNGSSVFDVLLFDGKSLCEKEISYFVRRCAYPGMASERERGAKETCELTSGNQPPEDDHIEQEEERAHNKSKRGDADEPKSARRRDVSNRNFLQRKKNSTHAVSSVSLERLSNRSPVTQEEKANAIQRAYAKKSHESLVVVMNNFHLNRSWHLTIPPWWSNGRLPDCNVIIELHVKGKLWGVTFVKKKYSSMLSAGWKKFVLDNSLEEGDVCLFSLASEKLNPVVIDVKIFRVVEEVVPPTPLYPPSSSQMGCERGNLVEEVVLPTPLCAPSSSQMGCERGNLLSPDIDQNENCDVSDMDIKPSVPLCS